MSAKKRSGRSRPFLLGHRWTASWSADCPPGRKHRESIARAHAPTTGTGTSAVDKSAIAGGSKHSQGRPRHQENRCYDTERSEEDTPELHSRQNLVCRFLPE